MPSMHNKFTTALVVAAAIAGKFASAMKPRRCFFVTDRVGVLDDYEQEGYLLSDLADLMQMYMPGQAMSEIKYFQSKRDNSF